jgi:hypothetical protein
MQERLAQLRDDLARRLAPVLRDVPTALFEELVNLIATIQYERESMRYADLPNDVPAGELTVGDVIQDPQPKIPK